MYRFLLHFVVLWLLVLSCQTDFRDLSPFGERGVYAVIEMPAGTNSVYKFDQNTGGIAPVMDGERQKTIDFLPFPANFGFVPGTQQILDGDDTQHPLRILVLGSNLKTGTVVETHLIGLLRIRESGKDADFLISVPLGREGGKIIDFRDFLLNHDAAKQLLEEWFVYHQGLPDTQILGWDDEKAAMQLLRSFVITAENQ